MKTSYFFLHEAELFYNSLAVYAGVLPVTSVRVECMKKKVMAVGGGWGVDVSGLQT